jgi:hypothetical protein
MFGNHTSTILMAAGVALAALVFLRASWRRRAAQSASPGAVADRGRQSLTNAPQELLRWQVEMHETARDLKAELDSKLSAWQTLVALARQERVLLERAIARAQGEEIEPPTSTLAAIESLGDAAAIDNPGRLAEVVAQIAPPPCDLPADLFTRDRASIQVGRLADQGLSPASIAEHLHLPIGDVELLLSLRSN